MVDLVQKGLESATEKVEEVPKLVAEGNVDGHQVKLTLEPWTCQYTIAKVEVYVDGKWAASKQFGHNQRAIRYFNHLKKKYGLLEGN